MVHRSPGPRLRPKFSHVLLYVTPEFVVDFKLWVHSIVGLYYVNPPLLLQDRRESVSFSQGFLQCILFTDPERLRTFGSISCGFEKGISRSCCLV